MNEKQLSHNEIIPEQKNEIKTLPICILTDGVNDYGNLGMIFRLADALKLEKIYLYNLKKNLNFKLLRKKSRTTSEYVKFEIIKNFSNILSLRKSYNFVILEKTNKSINYIKYIPKLPLCLIAGSERSGVSDDIIKLSDVSVHLPMSGVNTSVNVATAAAVVLYDFNNKINNYE